MVSTPPRLTLPATPLAVTDDRTSSLVCPRHFHALTHSVRPELVEGLFFLHPAVMPFWTYMLHCRGGAFYVGHSDDLERRIAQHQAGDVAGFTRDRLPVVLVWSEPFGTRAEALEMERRIKKWSRAKKMALIRGDWSAVSRLAKGNAENGIGRG